MARMTTDEQRDLLADAGRAYDPYRHDEDSIGFDNSYTGPSERELNGGCNRCGGWDDCYCPDPEPCNDCGGWPQAYYTGCKVCECPPFVRWRVTGRLQTDDGRVVDLPRHTTGKWFWDHAQARESLVDWHRTFADLSAVTACFFRLESEEVSRW